MNPDLDVSNISDNELVTSAVVPVVSSPERKPSLDCFVFRDTTDDDNSPDYCGNCMNKKVELRRCTGCKFMKYCSKDCQEKHWASHKVLFDYFKHANENFEHEHGRYADSRVFLFIYLYIKF